MPGHLRELSSVLRLTSCRYQRLAGRLYSNLPRRPDASVPANKTIPPPKIHRVTYEYPPPPKSGPEPPKESSPWRGHIPLFVGVGSLLWAGYVIYYFFGDSSANEQGLLQPEKFSPFRITFKQVINDDTQLIEIAPKYAASASLLKSGATIWNGKKIWSIQIKHPMIQIARNYTPLPLYFMQSDRPGEPPLLRIMGSSSDEGRMCLLVRRYADGEMSRYLHSLPVGADIEIRGPFIDCQIPYEAADSQRLRPPMLDLPSRMPPEPELSSSAAIRRASNLAMFTAGTGITVALQALLSPNNPPRGFTHVFYSCRTRSDVPCERFMLFLESVGRAKFHIYVDDEQRFLQPNDVPVPSTIDADPELLDQHAMSPSLKKYQSAVQQYADKTNNGTYEAGVMRAIVCGPPGYVAYISGSPGADGDLPIAGLLGEKGWTLSNTSRMLGL